MSLRNSILATVLIFTGIFHCASGADAGSLIGDLLDKVIPGTGKSIDQANKAIPQERPVIFPPPPEIAQSPTNVCKINPKLPQCDGIIEDPSEAAK